VARNSFRRLGPALIVIRNAGISVLRVPFRSLFLVRGDSMRPTLRDGDLILVRRGLEKGAHYGRGSIVVASIVAAEMPSLSGDNSPVTNVKRIVGLPGELVRVSSDGVVRIEEEPLGEPYLDPEARAAPGPGLSWLCDGNEYFLMGDHRADSGDSRRFGPVPAANIVGKLWIRLPTHRLLSRRSSHRAGRNS